MLTVVLVLPHLCRARQQGDGLADAVVIGGELKLGFMVERAPAMAAAWDEAQAHPDKPAPPAAALQPQLSLSTVHVSVQDVGLTFKGTWLSAVYNMLVRCGAMIRAVLASPTPTV